MTDPERQGHPHQDSTQLSQTRDLLSVHALEHYCTGGLGFVVTLLVIIIAYPWLTATAEIVPYLSSTLLVFTFAAVWIVVWLVLELVWEWRAGRLIG